MTNLEKLEARKSELLDRLAASRLGSIGDKPDAEASAGTTYRHRAYMQGIMDDLKAVNELILQEKAVIAAGANTTAGPWELNH